MIDTSCRWWGVRGKGSLDVVRSPGDIGPRRILATIVVVIKVGMSGRTGWGRKAPA
jgi:hypothetical protein